MIHTPPLIIVANDDTTYLELMQELLTEEGYVALVAPVDGNAYPVIRDKQPDLLILDIRLSNPDSGLLVLDLVRLDPTTTHIPILLCSTNFDIFPDRAEHLKAAGIETIAKPFSLEEMLGKVRGLLRDPPTA